MKITYPIVEEIKFREGTLWDCLSEMFWFSVKTFVFIGFGYLALLCFGTVFAEHLLKVLTPECISQAANL